jgi:preprotein translocase subunit SecA
MFIMQWLLRKIVGTKNDRDVKKMRPMVARINAFEEEFQKLSDDALKAKTAEFKARLANGETLADIEIEAFAVVKNACRRLCGTVANVCDHTLTWEMVPFDVQLIGGMALHHGKIAEMATGEGKTLVATMPAYLNALTGQGVHVVTVNDYLARRDSEWMGLVYKFLGLTVGCIQNQMDPATRRQHYACDITYGTNSEFGFDYLRDMGMAYRPEDQVQRGHTYAIVDEIDSILIDEARTPLIISGPAPYSTTQYVELKPLVERLYRKQRELCNQLVQEAKDAIEKNDNDTAMRKLYQVNQGMPKHPQLQRLMEDSSARRLLEKIDSMMLTEMHKEEGRSLREELYFVIEERNHDANLTDKGCEALSPNDPDAYLLPDIVSAMSDLDGNTELTEELKFEKRQEIQNSFANRSERIHCVDQLIRAYSLYEKDVQYVVQDNQVVIVDENTGRLMSGRRWSDGLHQAVEAKEGVKIERETQTLATITIQNYFRLYKKLSGMTGTAETEADEFHQIYKLDVMVIPTNRPVRRMDYNDFIYKTQREKYNAIIEEITECHKQGQPVLVGTISVDASELVSRMLRRQNIPHNVLNAKNHQREADIVANAGQPGAVTIATNMAGRGTDIKLGPGVVHIDRSVITSQASLESKIDGKTLRQILTDKPAGLHVIGSERHESRRIDRQLRGRCARQGDPGSSRFYVSLEDDLMRIFGSDKISKLMDRLGIEEGEVMEHKWLNKSIERAQRRVEQHNFSIRKRTLDYDDVMNKQREIIYGFRSETLQSEDVSPQLIEVAGDVINTQADTLIREDDEESVKLFLDWVNTKFPLGIKRDQIKDIPVNAEGWSALVLERVKEAYAVKVKVEDPERLRSMERYIVLNAVDTHWQEYLRSMDALRQGVGLRAYGQRDPLVEYKKEAYTMFSDLMDKIKSDITDRMFRAATSLNAFQSFLSALPKVQTQHATVAALGGTTTAPAEKVPAAPRPISQQEAAMEAALSKKIAPVRRDVPKVGRNEPCPCGSGKKYKSCHGANG